MTGSYERSIVIRPISFVALSTRGRLESGTSQSPPGLLSSLNSKREASYEKGLFSMSGQTAFSSAGTEGKCSIPVRFLLYSQTEFSIVLNLNLYSDRPVHQNPEKQFSRSHFYFPCPHEPGEVL